jgi:Helix-hairpin-helix motif
VALARPADREELAAVPGMGRLLADRIADGLLATLAGTAAGGDPDDPPG